MVQSVAVRGKFICGTRSAIGVRVKLFEHDLNIANAYSQPIQNDEYMLAINHDDVLNETYTDQDGNFFVHGTTVEVNQIQPILKVYHNCLLNGMPGFRKIHFIVPYHFTNYGIHAKRVLDLGIFNLEVILPVSMNVTTFLVLLILISTNNGFVNRNQSVEIRGRFMCSGQPLHRAAIELWDDDRSLLKSLIFILMQKRGPEDSYIARTNTDERGEFTIAATYQRKSEIIPYLYVYHRCDIDQLPLSKSRPMFKLWRTFVLKIPEQYVNTGNRALRILDLGDEILLENCNMRNELYYRRCAYSMPSPFLSRLTHHDFFLN
uniref:Transthyretin-like family protein n=1 Tax=Setaria digitata TaxID=48799 RepID=A0A915Q266_9BILA